MDPLCIALANAINAATVLKSAAEAKSASLGCPESAHADCQRLAAVIDVCTVYITNLQAAYSELCPQSAED